MIQVFEKIKAECTTCGTPLDGIDIARIGDKFYCRSDYEKQIEKPINNLIIEESEYWQRILGTDSGQFALNHDFTSDWTLTNATASSSKVWVSEAGGKVSKDFNLAFGKWYSIKVMASGTAGSILCYNSVDGTKLLGHDSFEDRFIALTDYIEFRNASASVNTISLIELREI